MLKMVAPGCVYHGLNGANMHCYTGWFMGGCNLKCFQLLTFPFECKSCLPEGYIEGSLKNGRKVSEGWTLQKLKRTCHFLLE